MYWPKSIGSPVLDSVRYAAESSRDVQTHYEKIVEVASWMAYEELPMPEFALPFGVGPEGRGRGDRFRDGSRFDRHGLHGLQES